MRKGRRRRILLSCTTVLPPVQRTLVSMSTTTTQGSGFIRFGAAQLTGIGSAVTRLVGGNGSVERSPRRHAPLWTAALR